MGGQARIRRAGAGAAWRGPRGRLVLALGLALFLLLGGFFLVQAYWFPMGFRLIHGLEILADALVYAWLVVTLIRPLRVGVVR